MNKTIPRVLAVTGRNLGHAEDHASAAPPLGQICGLFGYSVRTYAARDLEDFRRLLRFTGAVARLPVLRTDPLLVHVSLSGDAHAMRIGPDEADWQQLAPLVSDLCRRLAPHPAPVTLVVSVLGAPGDILAALVPTRGDCVHPPDHVFVFFEERTRPVETILAWTQLFGTAVHFGLAGGSAVDPARLQRLRTRLRDLGAGTLQYYHPGPAAPDAPFQSGPRMP